LRIVDHAETAGPYRVAGDRSARTAALTADAAFHDVTAGHVVSGTRRNAKNKRPQQQRTREQREQIVRNDVTTNA
jgi:hypothetical protein